tara:strand:- start:75 stop:545 length:471 start_codon:yes stop_codon:yes gene_type:complete
MNFKDKLQEAYKAGYYQALDESKVPLSPIAIAPFVGPIDPISPELRAAREKAKREYDERLRDEQGELGYPPDADIDGDGRLTAQEFFIYVVSMARELGLPDSIIKILLKYIDGEPSTLEYTRLFFHRNKLKRLLKRINKRFDSRHIPFDLPSELPF